MTICLGISILLLLVWRGNDDLAWSELDLLALKSWERKTEACAI